MKDRTTLLKILIPIIFLLCSCGGKAKMLFFAEDFWWNIVVDKEKLTAGLDDLAARNQYELEYIRLSSNVLNNNTPVVDVEEELKQKNPQLVLFSPYLSGEALRLSCKYQDIHFLVLDRLASNTQCNNLMFINFCRIESFKKAGQLLGIKLKNQELNRLMELDDMFEIGVGIVVHYLSPNVEMEINAFKEGLQLSHFPLERVQEEEIIDLKNPAELKEIILLMKENNVRIVLLKAFKLNLYGLEYLSQVGCYAIVEDWTVAGGFEEVVLLSIENDITSSIEKALNLMDKNNTGWDSSQIEGNVKLVWNQKL